MNEATIAQIETDVPERNWAGWFAVSAGIILGLTGLAKIYSAGGDVKLLGVMDPIFGVPFKQLIRLINPRKEHHEICPAVKASERLRA
jgi:hypothetical protein